MILAAGLSPAWQQIVRLDRLRVGEVNRARDVHWCASGKVLNVAIALKHLGSQAEAVSLLGGPPRPRIEQEFAAWGIAAEWIPTASATRVCTTVLDQAAATTTELVENAPAISAAEWQDFARAYQQRAARAQAVVLTGSLPQGVPKTLFRDLLANTPCPAVLDIRGEELWHALECQPAVVKPNREELGQTLDRELISDDDLLAAMRSLNQRGAQWVVVSQGAGVVWASSANDVVRFQVPPAQVVNPIGAGDCLAAGIATGMASHGDMPQAICLGIAAAGENVEHLLPARLDRAAVDARAKRIDWR